MAVFSDNDNMPVTRYRMRIGGWCDGTVVAAIIGDGVVDVSLLKTGVMNRKSVTWDEIVDMICKVSG
ncbi:MAG: hypothetical protein CUN56_00575 [Phototrophicales bacterium]|nr:MAG: hypothetical protein CUN56_00575 [Phototrophicales bacterium]